MSDNNIEHRPSQFNPGAGSQALSEAMAANAAKWRQINAPDQFNRGPYSPVNTGNPLMDMGLNMAGQAAYRAAGGQGQPRYITPFTPGMPQIQRDLAANVSSPMQQQMMQDFSRHTQPITEMGLQAMNQMGMGRQASALRRTMGQNSFMTDLAAMGNQNPAVEAVMGGNIFRGHNELLARAGSFQQGGPAAANPEMQMARSVAALTHANAVGRAVTDMTYRDPNTGKFNVSGNAGYTGGWGGEDMQRLTAQMASNNVSQEMTTSGGGRAMAGMSNMRVDPYTKAAMVGRMGRATAAVASLTGDTDPVEVMQTMQSNVGGGRAARNLDTLMREAGSMATIGGVAAAHGVDSRSAMAAYQGVAGGINNRLSGMLDPSGGTPMSGTSLGRAMARSASISALAEAGSTGNRSPEAMAELTAKYGQQQMNRFRSNEGREVAMAMHAMEVNPGAAIFRDALQQSVQSGDRGQTREIIRQVSEQAYGSRDVIQRTSRNDRAFADSLQRSERQEREGGKDPDAISDNITKVLNNADKSELKISKGLQAAKTWSKASRGLMKRLGLKADPEKMASFKQWEMGNEKGEFSIHKMMTRDKDGNEVKMFSKEELEAVDAQLGTSTGQERMRRFKTAMKGFYNDPNKKNLKEELQKNELLAETKYNGLIVTGADVDKSYSPKWVSDSKRWLGNTAGTPDQKSAMQSKLSDIGRLPPEEQGKAISDFMNSPDYAKAGGSEAIKGTLNKQLAQHRKLTKDVVDAAKKGPPVIPPDVDTAKHGDDREQAAKRDAQSAGQQEGQEGMGRTNAAGERIAQEESATKMGVGTRIAHAVNFGKSAVMGNWVGAAWHGAAGLGMDVGDVQSFTKSGMKAGSGGGGRGENAVTEVVLKSGSTFYLVDQDGKKQTMKTR